MFLRNRRQSAPIAARLFALEQAFGDFAGHAEFYVCHLTEINDIGRTARELRSGLIPAWV
jgi:hypothetical protein